MFKLVSEYKPNGDQPQAINYALKHIDKMKGVSLLQSLSQRYYRHKWKVICTNNYYETNASSRRFQKYVIRTRKCCSNIRL